MFVVYFSLGKTILPYQPPENVQEKMQKIFQDLFGRLNAAEPLKFQFPDRASKFQVQGIHLDSLEYVVAGPDHAPDGLIDQAIHRSID